MMWRGQFNNGLVLHNLKNVAQPRPGMQNTECHPLAIANFMALAEKWHQRDGDVGRNWGIFGWYPDSR